MTAFLARAVLPLLLAGYVALFSLQEHTRTTEAVVLRPTLPEPLARLIAGYYFRQVVAEGLYIKVAVFLGGRAVGTPPKSYAPILADHFDVMTALHPDLLDLYFLCESSLSWIDAKSAQRANTALARGIAARPDAWVIPFFAGFNDFRYLGEPKQAALLLRQASLTPGAPSWIGHLAIVLAAKGGDIRGATIWLRAMYKAEKDPELRKRYRADLKWFMQASEVLTAIDRYQQVYGKAPPNLAALVPDFVSTLPARRGDYELEYKPPQLRLHRIK